MAAQHAQELTRQQTATITDMQMRQRKVAALDEKYKKELADAKAAINQLHDIATSCMILLLVSAGCNSTPLVRKNLLPAPPA
ncbi:lysis system i-spanin subunit Rz [Pantoea agglomerans]